MSTNLLAEKNTFALMQGSKRDSRFFGRIRLFNGKKSISSKRRNINVYRLFGGKKYIRTYTGFGSREPIFWQDSTWWRKKSTSLKHRDINVYRHFGGKKKFALMQGYKHDSRFFGRILLFGGKKSTLSKRRPINVYRHFGGKKNLHLYSGPNTMVDFLAEFNFLVRKSRLRQNTRI